MRWLRTQNPPCIALAPPAAAPQLLRRTLVGYGGSYQVNLDDEEAVGLGGVELIRAATGKAARELGWKVSVTPASRDETREFLDLWWPVELRRRGGFCRRTACDD